MAKIVSANWVDPSSDEQSSPLIAAKIADILREEILSSEDGAFLGGEEDLLERFKVSRPTFRQTSRLLEQEQILVVKRGLGGGYFARRPGMGFVTRAAANYLLSRNISARQLLEASRSALRALVRKAALSTDEALRQRLASIRAEMMASDATTITSIDMHRFELAFGETIAKLADNPALELFISSLYYTVLKQVRQSSVFTVAERRATWFTLRIRLADAVLAREPEVAEAFSIRANDAFLEWLMQYEERSQ